MDGPTLKNLAQKHLAACEQRFSDPLLHTHFKHIKQDLAEHAYLFDRENSQEPPNGNFYLRYGVNLLVDHSQTTERPLIFETHPTFANLFGSLDGPCDTRDERYLPFLSIHAGSLLRAAGVFIVIKCEEMLTVEGLWEASSVPHRQCPRDPERNPWQPELRRIRPEPVSLPVKVLSWAVRTPTMRSVSMMPISSSSSRSPPNSITPCGDEREHCRCIGFIRMVAREENCFPSRTTE